MTRAELKKVLVVEKMLDKLMTTEEGAATLGLSTRQTMRLKKTYVEKGAQALAHQSRGRKPAHALDEEIKKSVVELYTTTYYGSNNCHFSELLEEHESIVLSSSSVRRILLQEGIKQAKQRRRSKAHQPRQRRSQSGMLWQLDATPFAWLEDRATTFALHAAIDDATGTVVGAYFSANECREGYSIVMKQGLKKYGVPLGIYSDRHTIFRSPNESLTLEQELAGESRPLSNFGKAMEDLHIKHIKAMTPQAKGRVERLWVTFQDRLVIELRLLGIHTMKDANKALPYLLNKHNRRFSVKAQDAQTAYMKLDTTINLDYIFTIRNFRKIGSGNTIAYGGKIYTLAQTTTLRLDVKTTVEVRETLAGEVILWIRGQALKLKETERPERIKQTKKAGTTQPRKPATNHPWRMNWSNNSPYSNRNEESTEAP
ncbi:ISNCY family transposase [Paenibacillus yanchengensis]|uniref:ISNCY family transposase n=1 Tax=Paenibacillus yanchengensis TaxID=2035833 RepID=A0ABW4YHF2_9BACL